MSSNLRPIALAKAKELEVSNLPFIPKASTTFCKFRVGILSLPILSTYKLVVEALKFS